jgi:glycosyltransferase
LLNRATLLPAALESVAAQTARPLEHIVVDGGSSDGSQDIARRAGALVIEAPGSSIYQAINIGIAAARGEVLCLLNSDDWFERDALLIATRALSARPELDVVRGRAVQGAAQDGADARVRMSSPMSLESVLFGPCNINACFFRRRLIERVGYFDETYRIASDREWLTRVVLSGATSAELPDLLYVYRAHADSLTIGANKPAERLWVQEHLRIADQKLSMRSLDGEQRRAFRAFAAKETVHLAWLHLRGGQINSLIAALLGGFRRDPIWPAFAARPLGQAIAHRFR